MNEEIHPWIELKVNINNQLKGLDVLEEELKSLGSLHKRNFWLPAAGSGSELELIYKIGENIIVGGLVWDLCKVLFLRLVKSLVEFYKRNEDYPLSSLKIEYDDITFRFVEIPPSKINHIGVFFDRLPKHLEFLKKHDIDNIDEIEINGFNTDPINDPNDDNLFRFWTIRCDYGMNIVQYDSENRSFSEL